MTFRNKDKQSTNRKENTAGYKKADTSKERYLPFRYSFSLSLSTIDFFVRFLYMITGIIIPITANTGIAAISGRIVKL